MKSLEVSFEGFFVFCFFLFFGDRIEGLLVYIYFTSIFWFSKRIDIVYMVGSASVTKSLKMFVMSWKWSKDELTLLELVELVLIAV